METLNDILVAISVVGTVATLAWLTILIYKIRNDDN